MPALLKPLMVETAKQKFKMPQGTASGGVTQQTCQNYITTMCDAIVSAVEQWRQTAMLSGVTINGPIAKGGKVTGPALQPVILTLAPKSNPWEKNLSDAISGGVSDCWKDWQGSLQVPGLPWYPQFAAWPDLVAPPMPNVPSPLSALGQAVRHAEGKRPEDGHDGQTQSRDAVRHGGYCSPRRRCGCGRADVADHAVRDPGDRHGPHNVCSAGSALRASDRWHGERIGLQRLTAAQSVLKGANGGQWGHPPPGPKPAGMQPKVADSAGVFGNSRPARNRPKSVLSGYC